MNLINLIELIFIIYYILYLFVLIKVYLKDKSQLAKKNIWILILMTAIMILFTIIALEVIN